MRIGKFDTNLDPFPKSSSACLMNSNSKRATQPLLCIKLLITLIRAKVSELQMEESYNEKEENFTLCDIMHSGHNVHHSNQNMKCST